MELITYAGIGLVVGLLVGAIHLWLLSRSVSKLTHEPASGPRQLLMSAPLRVGIPVVAPVLVLVGLLVARWRPPAAWALGLVALAAGMAAPGIYLRATTPPQPVTLSNEAVHERSMSGDGPTSPAKFVGIEGGVVSTHAAGSTLPVARLLRPDSLPARPTASSLKL